MRYVLRSEFDNVPATLLEGHKSLYVLQKVEIAEEALILESLF